MSEKLNDGILQHLECMVCMNYMAKPIVSCMKGHSICFHCGRRVNSCPSCKRPILLTHRNYTLEAISELLEYPCTYADAGCKEMIKYNAANEHRVTCSYRPYPCMLGGALMRCLWEGTRFQYTAHALAHHKDKVSILNNNCYTWTVGSPVHEVNMIKVFGEVFLLHRKLVKTQRNGVIMYWAMQYIGKAEDKIQFNYKLHIACEEYENRYMTFMEYCCDDLRTIDEIIAEEFCIAVPLQQFEWYQDKNGKVIYEVSINKI